MYGQFIFLSIIILEFTAILICLSVASVEDNTEERTLLMDRVTEFEGGAFFVIAFVLCLSVAFLINRLIKKRNQGIIS